MADVSKLILNGETYNIKDATGRSNIATLSTQVNNLSGDVDALDGRLDNVDGEISDLTDDINAHSIEIENIEGDINRLNTAVDNSVANVNQLNTRVAVAETKVDNVVLNDANQSQEINAIQRDLGGYGVIQGQNSNDIEVLKQRVDSLASLPSGSTSGDAELIDIRQMFNGKTASNAGSAVREESKWSWINDCLSGFVNYLLPYYAKTYTANGVTATLDGDTYTFSGTATNRAYINIILTTTLPVGLNAGDWVRAIIETNCDSTEMKQQIYYATGGGSDWILLDSPDLNYKLGKTNDIQIQIPSNATGLLCRFEIYNGVNVNGKYAKFKLVNANINTAIVGRGTLPENSSLNDINVAGAYLGLDRTYVGKPSQEGAVAPFYLLHFIMYNCQLQLYIPFMVSDKIYARGRFTGSDWRSWNVISGGGGGQNIYNIFENSYNVTASPTINTDTNNYLASTGDTSDRTNDIASMLATTGICHLGSGDFYVANLNMPNNTMIIGSGNATRVILGNGNYVFKLGSECCIKDLSIHGSLSDITPSVTVRNYHGILWEGTYTYDQNAPYRSTIENVKIVNFTGGGITCRDTGYSSSSGLLVTDCYIVNCDAGINISYWSEYSKFENVSCKACYYGCVNNGGNNLFNNCDFSSNKMGFLMDNSSSQSPNNSHGSCTGCIFNHEDSNTGYGIRILNCDNGFVFTGCQIYFGKIGLVDSDGISVVGCNFGLSNCDIEINGGGAIIFANNLLQGRPTINIENNSKVHFINNYIRSSGALVEP